MELRRGTALIAVALASLLSSPADAHWCNDLWDSAYNLVVRPETDTVSVPASGSANLTIYVQNNMEYALPSFTLTAKGSGVTIAATRQTQKVSNTLLPGEKAKYTLAISKSGGGTFNAADLEFSVGFGNSSMQPGSYGTGTKAAMIKLTDGSLLPAPPPPGIGEGGGQANQLFLAALTDFADTEAGLDKLMSLYCAGRASWSSGSAGTIKSNCPDATTTVCPTTVPSSGNGSKFDYMHLWSAGELGARKSALGARAAVLRERLKCGINDKNDGFAGFAMFVLGYLGEDAGARSFIEDKIGAGGDLGTIAKAALLLMNDPDDMAKYKADVTAGTSSSSTFVKAACAAALGIVAKDDATVSKSLIPLCQWIEPDTSDNGAAIYSAQLLNLVAWDRRGWAPKAGDTGEISFYGGVPSGGGGSATGTGGRVGGTGGAGARNGGASGRGGSGGATSPGSGGSRPASGGRSGSGGSTAGVGGAGGSTDGSGGNAVGNGGNSAVAGSSGPSASGGSGASQGGSGGAPRADGSTPGSGGSADDDASGGSRCNLGRGSSGSAATVALAALALLLGRRRRR